MNAPDVVVEPLLIHTRKGSVATLTLNRPRQYNALSSALLTELQQALEAIAQDRSIRAVILAANGRGFCAGHDLAEIRSLSDKEAIERLFLQCSAVMTALGTLPQPVIAKVHGIATAAGCQLVAACDLAVAAERAQFATPGVNVGAFCATPSVALGRAVSRKHAMEMLLTGAMISAARAEAIGLVNRVVSADQLDACVEELANLIASKSPQAVATGKRIFYRQLELPLAEAYRMASEAIARDFVSDDGREGLDAFLAKRAPQWS